MWDVWRGKVKTKVRKISTNIRGTGGGLAMPELSDVVNKILENAGRASVYGFADLEQVSPYYFVRCSSKSNNFAAIVYKIN